MKYLKENSDMVDQYKEWSKKEKGEVEPVRNINNNSEVVRLEGVTIEGDEPYKEFRDGSIEVVTGAYGVVYIRPVMIDTDGTNLESGVSIRVPQLEDEAREFFSNISTFDIDNYLVVDEIDIDSYVSSLEIYIENNF